MPETGTGITAAALEARLAERLAPSSLEVLDESAAHAGHAGADGTGFGTHFRVRIASPMFAGKTKVACHRLVYDALRSFIDQGLHALAIETLQPHLPSKTTP
jgi:BolA protein